MKKKLVLWCLESPKGELFVDTMGPTKQDVWSNGAYETVGKHEGEAWRVRYWNKWDASIRSALKLGWKFVRVEVRKVKS